jgi:hypothetical protein
MLFHNKNQMKNHIFVNFQVLYVLRGYLQGNIYEFNENSFKIVYNDIEIRRLSNTLTY